jgi:ABC-2 type transport system permease protein
MCDKIVRDARIVAAIAAKDIRDAFRNKTLLTVIVSTLFVLVAYRLLPTLSGRDELPRLVLYPAGHAGIVQRLDGDAAFDLVARQTGDAVLTYLRNEDQPALGLVLPDDLNARVAAGQVIRLQGYRVHWLGASKAESVRNLIERRLSAALDAEVTISLEGGTVYTQEESSGYAFLGTASILIAITMIGLVVTPNLIMDERQSGTLDAVLLSPASRGQLVLGKAVAGLLYASVAGAVALALNAALVTRWGLALLTLLLHAAFVVALGLLFGVLIKLRQQLLLYMQLPFALLMLPIFLADLGDLLTPSVARFVRWVPTVALGRVYRLSYSNSAPWIHGLPEVILVTGFTAALLAMDVWLVRRASR